MTANITLTRTVLGYPVTAELTVLDNGLHVLLTGGCKTHIGAVSICDQDGTQTLELPAHREKLVSIQWAERLYAACRRPVTAACGIHYDLASREDIKEILAATDSMLEEMIGKL